MSENIIRDLVKKLKSFREAVLSIHKGGLIKSNLIPSSVRQEAAKVYMEHGGLDILMDVLHVSADQIREWSRNVRGDSEYYTKKEGHGIVSANSDITLPVKRKKKGHRNYKFRDSIINTLTPALQRKCDALKTKIDACQAENRKNLPYELKKEIADLVHEAGHYKNVAVLLGMNEKVVAGWSYYYSTRNEVHQVT
jgi:ubiquinone biosynthesis protein COQ9